MADDTTKSSVVRQAKIAFVKDDVENIVHYETDADCVQNLSTAINIAINNLINSDEFKDEIVNKVIANLKQAFAKDYATIDSPVFTGAPKAPTPTVDDNSTKIATTEFVNKIANNIVMINANEYSDEYLSKKSNENQTVVGTVEFNAVTKINNDVNIIDSSKSIKWMDGDTEVGSISATLYSGQANKALYAYNDEDGLGFKNNYAKIKYVDDAISKVEDKIPQINTYGSSYYVATDVSDDNTCIPTGKGIIDFTNQLYDVWFASGINVKLDNQQSQLDNCQEKLTFDTTPTSGSTNPVTSDGIYKAINDTNNLALTGTTTAETLTVTTELNIPGGKIWIAST
jgi:hypothetical protein